jgi:hypothetical protein
MPDLTTDPSVDVTTRIISIRGQIKRLNQQVRRNMEKFPGDFLFQLEAGEVESLRIHFASLNKGRGAHRKHAPLVFTEHGAIMAATVLSSPRAVQNERLCRSSVREVATSPDFEHGAGSAP